MISTGVNCIAQRYGTGVESCSPTESALDGFILTPKGWTRNKTSEDFDEAYVDEQIQLGNFVPFVGAFEATVETPDPTTQDSQTGLTSVVRQGLPVFTFTFQKGMHFHKAAFSHNSNNEFDVLLVYKTGYIKVAETVDGTKVKGLTVGMFNTNGYQENNGSNASQTVLRFQVINEQEYNVRAKLLTQLDFDPSTKMGIVNTLLTTPELPAVADVSVGTINVPVVWAGNEQFSITGLSSTNFQLTVNGAEVAIDTMAYNATTRMYEITPDTAFSAGQSVKVDLWDNTNNRAVTKLGSKFYQGSVTVTAQA